LTFLAGKVIIYDTSSQTDRRAQTGKNPALSAKGCEYGEDPRKLVDAEPDAVIVSEIEFRQVAVQMLL
jgi:hypothetical protein